MEQFGSETYDSLGSGTPNYAAALDVDNMASRRVNGAFEDAKGASAGMNPVPAQYQSLFEESGKRNGVDPGLLARIGRQESGFRADAVSPAGARGLMQFMPSTAADLGLTPQTLRNRSAAPAATWECSRSSSTKIRALPRRATIGGRQPSSVG